MTIKQNVLKVMIEAHPNAVNTSDFLMRYLYTFRNRLSELKKYDGINYTRHSSLKKNTFNYTFATQLDFDKAVEYIGETVGAAAIETPKETKQQTLI